jgi:uncharacterized protein (DUF2236 family)
VLPSDDAALLSWAGITDLPDPEEGLFRAGCWLRKVSTEPVMLFGGGRALLLEVAHPLVAAGVARHSSFRTDPFGRLRRTLDAVSQLVFAERGVALAAARRVEAAHHAVHGTLGQTLGPFESTARYDGRAPDLVRWVWATLADTSLVVYDHFVRPLEPEQREAYYRDHRTVGRLLGVPAEDVPPDYPAFRRYFDALVGSPDLCVGDEGREIAQSVLHPPGGLQGGGTLRLVTTALLPPRLRVAFGLPWDADRAGRFETLAANVRRLRQDA